VGGDDDAMQVDDDGTAFFNFTYIWLCLVCALLQYSFQVFAD
jgi:hypothetical protein